MSDSEPESVLKTHSEQKVEQFMENNRKRLHSVTVTVKYRANQRGNNDFHAESGKLICRVCIKVVDHTRQNSVGRHKATEMHMRQKNVKTTAENSYHYLPNSCHCKV